MENNYFQIEGVCDPEGSSNWCFPYYKKMCVLFVWDDHTLETCSLLHG